MRKLLLGFALMFIASSTFATHLMGGEITVKQNNPGEYIVKLSLYRDTLGINISGTQYYDLYDGMGNAILTFEAMAMDSANSGAFLPGYPYGVEQYHYIDTISNLNAPGTYSVHWDQCCRNAAIVNASSPSSESMFLYTEFTIDSAAANSTPVFLAPPVIYLPIMQPWQYNPMPFDPDGDSLHWSLTTPLDDANTPIAGYVTPFSDPSNPFSIDPNTGVISWTANTLGNFVCSILVEEYRNGVKIGHIHRDMQFIVTQAQSSSMPTFNNLSNIPVNGAGYMQFDLLVGNTFNYSFLASDDDVNDQLYMYAYSPVFNMSSPATFSTQYTSGTNNIQGDFTWTPDATALGDPHLMTVRVLDGLFAFDITVFLDVTMNTSIGEQNMATVANVYPNPSNGTFHLNLNLPQAEQARIAIMDLQGRMVESYTRQLGSGQHVLGFQPNVAAGTYLLQVQTEAGVISTQKILISK